jgi:hyperosmotically inducible protein
MRPLRCFAVAAGIAALTLASPVFAKSQAPDAWLTTKAKIAVLSAVGTAGTSIHVDTVDGRVTLHGQVRSEDDKKAAEEAARKIEGVTEVRNLLQVVPAKAEKRVAASDEQIQEKVEHALKRDPALADSSITVQSVNNGTVLLAGKADSLSEHLRALQDAREVAGVRQVASEIESPDAKGDERAWSKYSEATKSAAESTKDSVKSTAESAKDTAKSALGSATSGVKSASKSIKETTTDAYITSAAKMRLIADKDTPGTDINVDTDRGVVTLFGTVPTPAVKRKAAAEASKVAGVKRVKNELQVVPSGVKQDISKRDSEIESNVERAVGNDRSLKDANIHVEVRDGVARLSGTVPNESSKMAAETKVKKIDGVRKVQDDLQIRAD